MRPAVPVVALVLLAGCSGLVASPDETSETTLTPAPVPDLREYPAAVGPGGLNVDALAERHAAALHGRSFTVVTNRTVTHANGTVRSSVSVDLAVSAARNFDARVSVVGTDSTFLGADPASGQLHASGQRDLRRLVLANSTSHGRYLPASRSVGTYRYWIGTVSLDRGPRADAEATLGSFETRVVGRTTADGRVLFELVGERATGEAFLEDRTDLRDVRDARLRAVVTETGFVTAYGVVYTATTPDGETVRVRRVVRYRNVGETSVDRPGWYEEGVSGPERAAGSVTGPARA